MTLDALREAAADAERAEAKAHEAVMCAERGTESYAQALERWRRACRLADAAHRDLSKALS